MSLKALERCCNIINKIIFEVLFVLGIIFR